jgi:glyoxylase-like metal-dependent hydrolase (beta-lactamase superfamily II)
MSTPGHTPTCLSFHWRDRVFCGGLLTLDTCPDQPHPADPAALWDSVTQRIFTLPDETLLFAGYGRRARAVSTVLEQRRWHPFFARLTRDAFLARVAALPGRTQPAQPAGLPHEAGQGRHAGLAHRTPQPVT